MAIFLQCIFWSIVRFNPFRLIQGCDSFQLLLMQKRLISIFLLYGWALSFPIMQGKEHCLSLPVSQVGTFISIPGSQSFSIKFSVIQAPFLHLLKGRLLSVPFMQGRLLSVPLLQGRILSVPLLQGRPVSVPFLQSRLLSVPFLQGRLLFSYKAGSFQFLSCKEGSFPFLLSAPLLRDRLPPVPFLQGRLLSVPLFKARLLSDPLLKAGSFQFLS